jgi:hypothetical protein
MTVESASYIDDLSSSNPATTDFLYEGDDHIRLIKAVLLASFPNIGGAVTATHTELNATIGASGSLLSNTTTGQWVQLGATSTITGTPSVIDFVNGTGGVIISALYDQYLITFSNLKATDGAGVLQLQSSENAGVTFPAATNLASWQVDTIAVGASTVAQATLQQYVRFGGATPTPSTDPGASGHVLVHRPLSGSVYSTVFSEVSIGTSGSVVKTSGIITSTTNQFNALRLLMSSSTFAGSNARVSFFGRRV